MKNWLITCVVMLTLAAGAFGVGYYWRTAAAGPADAMTWLRDEFQLTDGQYASIKTLHMDYHEQCMRHCAAILEARENQAPGPVLARLEEECEQSMARHFKQVAALMSPEQGARYLGTVLPRIHGYSHAQPPSLKGTP